MAVATAGGGGQHPRPVNDRPSRPDDAAVPDHPLGGDLAASFAALVASANQRDVDGALEQMTGEELRSLAVALATQVNAAAHTVPNAAAHTVGAVVEVGPDAICAIAITTAAQSFGTSRDRVLGSDRCRAVTDARAVAMTAARRVGLTLPVIAHYFAKNHTSVMYAQTKVANNPRLDAVCARIVDRLNSHYVQPNSGADHFGVNAAGVNSAGVDLGGGSGAALQRAALSRRRDEGDLRRPREEDTWNAPTVSRFGLEAR